MQYITDAGTVSDSEVKEIIKAEPSEYSSFPIVISDDLVDLCPVCSDRVSGYHYGLQTCESCKGLSLSIFAAIFILYYKCSKTAMCKCDKITCTVYTNLSIHRPAERVERRD